MDEDFAVGASASLNRTISALLEAVDNPGPRVRGNLRASMQEAIADLVIEWAEWGYQHGHRAAYEKFRDTGDFPPSIQSDQGTWLVMADCDRHVVLNSRIRRN